jgi:hypothetical protein
MEDPLVLKAAEFAAQKHKGQTRKGRDGSPYIDHSKSVARVLAEVGGVDDPEILAAAWLHDTLEDTDTTSEELISAFGKRVCRLSVTLFATLNTFLLVELTIVIATTIVLRKYVFDNEQLIESIKSKAIIAKERGSSLTISTIKQLQRIPTKTFRKPVPELSAG